MGRSSCSRATTNRSTDRRGSRPARGHPKSILSWLPRSSVLRNPSSSPSRGPPIVVIPTNGLRPPGRRPRHRAPCRHLQVRAALRCRAVPRMKPRPRRRMDDSDAPVTRAARRDGHDGGGLALAVSDPEAKVVMFEAVDVRHGRWIGVDACGPGSACRRSTSLGRSSRSWRARSATLGRSGCRRAAGGRSSRR